MKLLLDTHVLLAVLGAGSALITQQMRELFRLEETELTISSASLWEIAIRSRSGKLDLGFPIYELPAACDAAGVGMLAIDSSHVLHDLQPLPTTRDPFDRLQAAVEGMRLVTIDRALAGHPLVWTPSKP